MPITVIGRLEDAEFDSDARKMIFWVAHCSIGLTGIID